MLKVYRNTEEFWREVSPHLLHKQAENSLCLGLSYNFRKQSEGCLYQAALFDYERFLGSLVISRYKPHVNFLPSAGTEKKSAAKLYEGFLATKIRASGLIGELKTADTYRKFFEEAGRRFKVNLPLGIYRCKKVKPPDRIPGLKFRSAKSGDVKVIGNWIEEFHDEATPHDPRFDYQKFAEAKVNQKAMHVVELGGELVSMASVTRDIETACTIAAVYTPKNLRGRGYASAVTAGLTQKLLDQGKREVVLNTDMTNPTSNKIYQKIGYRFVCDSIHYGMK